MSFNSQLREVSNKRAANAGGVQSGGGTYGDKTPKGYKTGQIQQFTPEQMELYKNAFSFLGPDSYLSKLAGGDQSAFEQMEAPAHRQFNEKIGDLSSRFSGMGTGARKSSGFQNTASAAASNFAQDLQSKRMDYQRQALRDMGSMTSELLGQRPYERQLVEKAKPWWQEAATGFAQGAGQGLAKAATGGF